jgi:hypothetical protein
VLAWHGQITELSTARIPAPGALCKCRGLGGVGSAEKLGAAPRKIRTRAVRQELRQYLAPQVHLNEVAETKKSAPSSAKMRGNPDFEMLSFAEAVYFCRERLFMSPPIKRQESALSRCPVNNAATENSVRMIARRLQARCPVHPTKVCDITLYPPTGQFDGVCR